MSDPIAELSRRAHELAPEDRARLAQELLASVEAELAPHVDAAWDDELRRRVADLEAGTAQLLPANEVFERARRMLR